MISTNNIKIRKIKCTTQIEYITVQIPFLRENEDRTSEKELLKVAGFSYYNQSKSNVIFS